MSDYLADGLPIDAREFTRRACDPSSSAVVEACAGSGKTWLLVSRILRALLMGAAPGEILAITFTRRAAQEMHARLLRDLESLAQGSDDEVRAALELRGMAAADAHRSVEPARHLYERVVTARVPLTIETFHGWFWQLIDRAPLGCGVPFAPVLLEAAERTRADAWLHFVSALLRPERAAERAAWETLIDDLGESVARDLLQEFLHKRAEWWSFEAADHATAAARALDVFGAVGDDDPAAEVRADPFIASIRTLMEVWQSLRSELKTADQAFARAEAWLAATPKRAGADLRAACHLVLTKGELTPIQVLTPERLAGKLANESRRVQYADAHRRVTERLQSVLATRRTWRARRLNRAGLACGRLLVDAYRALKDRDHTLDFTDLEWHAYRLLADPDNAAYMQARLDARYRHVLVDEFQDTNALQWQVLQSWLAAYGPAADDDVPAAASDRPTVFVVGDPKQSIYRFRRAEPRVFGAAIDMLRRDFGAAHLRTNVTRRNAEAIIGVLNRCLLPDPLFQPQSTLVDASRFPGAFVLLPLAEPTAATRTVDEGATLRDVLTSPRVERDNDTRYREGRVIANEIAAWRGRLQVDDQGLRPARWKDVLLLVRRRTHLADYESALRDAGIPFVSDRRGGLLETLEADDITALLQFLTAPDSDLRLAQVLRAPVFGCSDEDLMQIAVAPGASWWQRLRQLDSAVSAELSRARDLLRRWLDSAGTLPVHDLLDRVYFEGDLRRRYAAAAPAAMQAQVQANLDAFIELALAVDAGRFPSLPRFIDELMALRRHGSDDAPDEGLTGTDDAVRVMTIHGAKGLEADIVVLADAHMKPPTEGAGVMVSWMPGSPGPDHFSLVVGGEGARDDARGPWFAREDEQREQEDWNLLYVAATRARQVLVVAGSAPASGALQTSWYRRLEAARDLSVGAAPAVAVTPTARQRVVRDFLPPALRVGRRCAPADDGPALRLGRAFHALLELGPEAPLRSIALVHGLDDAQARSAAAAADRVRAAHPEFARAGTAELDIFAADGTALRIDRLVEQDEAIWVIDFKWSMSDAERPAYEAQVRRYAETMRTIRSDKPVRAGIITAAGAFTELR